MSMLRLSPKRRSRSPVSGTPRFIGRAGSRQRDPAFAASARNRRGASIGAVTPRLAVGDLLGRVARLQLAERTADRGVGHCHALVTLQRAADLGGMQGAR